MEPYLFFPTKRGDIGERIDSARRCRASRCDHGKWRCTRLAIPLNALLERAHIHHPSPRCGNGDHVLARDASDHCRACNGEVCRLGGIELQSRSRWTARCPHPCEHDRLQSSKSPARQKHAIGANQTKEASEGADKLLLARGHRRRLVVRTTVVVEGRDQQIA